MFAIGTDVNSNRQGPAMELRRTAAGNPGHRSRTPDARSTHTSTNEGATTKHTSKTQPTNPRYPTTAVGSQGRRRRAAADPPCTPKTQTDHAHRRPPPALHTEDGDLQHRRAAHKRAIHWQNTHRSSATRNAHRKHADPDPDPEDEDRAYTQTNNTNSKISFFFITWVLISTYILCGYTHHNDHPTKLTPIKFPLRPHPLISAPSIYPSKDHFYLQTHTNSTHKCHPSQYLLLLSSKLSQSLNLHQALPPRSKHTPNAPRPPPSPTQHHNTTTKVSKTTCTYHMLTQAKQHQKTKKQTIYNLTSKNST